MDWYFYPLRLVGAALLIAAPSPLLAASPAVQSDATALVLKPLSLVKKKDLDFGTLASATTAGTATLDPTTGTVTTTGGVTALSGTSGPATFVGVGTKNAVYQIRLPTTPITITRVGGTETMTVSTWTLDGATNRHVDAFEAFEFNVGARLAVGANQVPGTYVGTFDVTVHYP